MKTEMKFEHQKLNLRQINKLIQFLPHATIAAEEELDLIAAYRVLNEPGRQALLKVALDFARTPAMRNKWVRGI